MEKICGWCGFTGDAVAACSGCKCVQYCGTECQTNAWSRSSPLVTRHKDQCHLLAQVCEISARLAKEQIGQQMMFIGKPVKRAASESPDKTDPRQTKQVVLSTPEDSPSSKSSETSQGQGEGVKPKKVRDTNLQSVLRPLSKDVLRLISLMTLLDAGTLMRASPAWRVFYEQLNWKQIILSRWDDSPAYATTVDSEEERSRRVPIPGGGLKSIGRWLFDNSIFRLYPEVLLDRSLYAPSPDQQARIDRINRERGEQQAKMLETDSISRRDLETTIRLDEETEALEYEILFARVQAIVIDTDTQHALMNICILYRMYEHNVALATLEGAIPDADSLTLVDQIARGSVIQIGANDGGPRLSFFPVELLSRTLETADGMPLLDIVSDAWSGETPESLIQLSRYLRYLKSAGIRFPASTLTLFVLELNGVANIPRALVACNSLFPALYLRECPVWSAASFRNLSQMSRLENLQIYRPEWRNVPVDVVATCPGLTFLKFINLPRGRFSVSPQYLRESAPGSGVFGARALTENGPYVHITLKEDDDVLEEDSLIAPPRKLPPGPFAGLPRNEHIERTMRRAFEQYSNKASGNPGAFANDEILFARLMAELRKRNLFEEPDPTSEKEYERLINIFCLALNASGVSPIEMAQKLDDPRNTALPFNVWFERGLEYYDNTYAVLADGTRAKAVFKTIPSHARVACQMSADKRRFPGAFPSLEELAEAMVAWRASVYNLAVYSTRSDNPRRSYCKSIAARSDEDAWKNAIRPEADFWYFYNSDSGKLTAIPPELVMMFVLRSSAADNPATQKPRVSFSGCYGDIPVWLWLLNSRIDGLSLIYHILPYVPPQLMYHPGISTFECRESIAWGTIDKSLQWDLFRIAPEGRPEESSATPGTMLHQYHHDFFRLVIAKATGVKFDCFPPIVTENYQGGFELETTQ